MFEQRAPLAQESAVRLKIVLVGIPEIPKSQSERGSDTVENEGTGERPARNSERASAADRLREKSGVRAQEIQYRFSHYKKVEL